MLLFNVYSFKMSIILLWVRYGHSISIQYNKHSYFMDSGAENDVVEMIAAKDYIPADMKYFPKTTLVKSVDNDGAYLLSKLTDEELIKLLNDQPKKKEYDLNDIIRLNFGSKYESANKVKSEVKDSQNPTHDLVTQSGLKNRFITATNKPQLAFFKLDNKHVDPFNMNDNSDPNYNAVQKLNNLLYNRPLELEKDKKSSDNEEKKEVLFDVLVSQLRKLCCKKRKHGKRINKRTQYFNLAHNYLKSSQSKNGIMMHEQLFLIVNDDIKSNGSGELISVDPESLAINSSALLLGPITTPLSDSQLQIVMSRISNELSKLEYLPLLRQISDGTLTGGNIKLVKSLISGSETRRYIKPHRCNHQSKLARIYGGPKWLICTGYLNLNTPSLYD